MACDIDKFTINRGMSNEFILTIKQDSSTLPMVIDITDTFEVRLYSLSDDIVKATINMIDDPAVGVVEVDNAAGGKLKIILHNAFVDTLVYERGDRADGYYPKAMYRLAVDCSTVSNGNFVAVVNEVYVR